MLIICLAASPCHVSSVSKKETRDNKKELKTDFIGIILTKSDETMRTYTLKLILKFRRAGLRPGLSFGSSPHKNKRGGFF